MFASRHLRSTRKPPGHVKCPGGFAWLPVLWAMAFSCTASTPLSLAFSFPDEEPPLIVERSTEKLIQQSAQHKLSINISGKSFNLSVKKPDSDLVVMSLHDLAEKVPALQVLELPFFYDGLAGLHNKIDGELGEQLRSIALKNGWVILEWWDEGMQAMTGNRRYDKRINLSGMEFILLRDDPMAQLQYTALNAWSRRVYPQSSQQLLHECVVGSRSATVAQIWSERLDRVHLSLSLNQYRYEGQVLVAPLLRWKALPESVRMKLKNTAASMRAWQRKEALTLEQVALAELKKSGMDVYELSADQRKDFVKSLPPWQSLLPAALSSEEKAALLAAASSK